MSLLIFLRSFGIEIHRFVLTAPARSLDQRFRGIIKRTTLAAVLFLAVVFVFFFFHTFAPLNAYDMSDVCSLFAHANTRGVFIGSAQKFMISTREIILFYVNLWSGWNPRVMAL